jgi:hypothetical protein
MIVCTCFSRLCHLVHYFLSSSNSNAIVSRKDQYLLLKLVHGQLHLTLSDSSLTQINDRKHEIRTQTLLNDSHWHHISLYYASDYHLEFTIDMTTYSLMTTAQFRYRIYFGRPSDMYLFNPIRTLQACLASLTINSRSMNLREFIRSHVGIRNECFLDSQCPLRTCQHTGVCLDRIQCQCQHTSFQGRFCTNFKLGYDFHNTSSGLVFHQPWSNEPGFHVYKLSFGLMTQQTQGEIIRINDHLRIELYRGHLRMKYINQELLRHDRTIHDGRYHLIRIEYNQTGYLTISVDHRIHAKQLNVSLPLDRPLVLFIGQHAQFKHSFQVYKKKTIVRSVYRLFLTF